MNAWIEHWVRPEIRALTAYHVPPSTGFVKLDAMENPYPWPPELATEWLASLATVALNRYPDPTAAELIASLRLVMEVPSDQSIVLGNGSDELIQMLILLVGGPGRVVLALEPTFVMYRMIAQFTGMRFVGVPLRDPDFSLDLAATLEAIDVHQPAVVFLAYPNNPTGNHWSRAEIETILRAAPGLVVLDEAYSPFARDSFMKDLGSYPNLLVMRTLSKWGLAGLRLGYLCGPNAWLEQLEKLRLPYNINVLTQASASFALRHAKVFGAQARLIRAERDRVGAALGAIDGISVYPSDANFLLFRTAPHAAGSVFEALKAARVLIKNLSPMGGSLTDCLRVTVGTPDENQKFLTAIQSALAVRSA
ncbi:MAG: histidinol-phosphate transaminase [Thiotrichales bacterium]